jgi:hypothetical protein
MKLDTLAKIGSSAASEHPVKIFKVNMTAPGGKAIARLEHKENPLQKLPTIAVYKGGEMVYEDCVPMTKWKVFLDAVRSFGGLPKSAW